MDEDELFDELLRSAEKKDFVRYRKLVDKYPTLLDEFMNDWWVQMFVDNKNDVVSFWIGYSRRKLSIHHVAVIKDPQLFSRALRVPHIDMSGWKMAIEPFEESDCLKDKKRIEQITERARELGVPE
jgi:hypothetical protein